MINLSDNDNLPSNPPPTRIQSPTDEYVKQAEIKEKLLQLAKNLHYYLP